MEKLFVPLAYKYAAIAVMLAEINYCANELRLPEALPITRGSLRTEHVAKPFLTGFGGTLETDTFSFVFFKSGRLRQIVRINRFERVPLRELQSKQARMRSLIDTNGAYQLATNWLTAISVDIAKLEGRYPSSVEQKTFYPDSTQFDDPNEKRKRVMLLPIFHVKWGNPKEPAVMVSMYGPTKELLGIYLDDESVSNRPKDLLKDVDILLAIPDVEFSGYSENERERLLMRFAAVPIEVGYPVLTSTNKLPSTADQRLHVPMHKTQ